MVNELTLPVEPSISPADAQVVGQLGASQDHPEAGGTQSSLPAADQIAELARI
jgi:hypothetical protein